MFSLVLASAFFGSGDFAADIRNAEDFIALKSEVAKLKADVAELKARCKCGATQSSGPIDIGGNPVTVDFVLPPSTAKTKTKTACNGPNCSLVDSVAYPSSYGGCSAGGCGQTFWIQYAQPSGFEQQTFGVRHFKHKTKCKGCN